MLVEKVRNLIQNKIKALKEKIISLRNSSKLEQELLLLKHEEAFQIATVLGIENRVAADCSSYIFREPNYCIGFRKLNVELEFLKKREWDNPYTENLHDLELKIALLQNIKIEEEGEDFSINTDTDSQLNYAVKLLIG